MKKWFKKAIGVLCAIIVFVAIVLLICCALVAFAPASWAIVGAAKAVVAFFGTACTWFGFAACVHNVALMAIGAALIATVVGTLIAPEEFRHAKNSIVNGIRDAAREVGSFAGSVVTAAVGGVATGLGSSGVMTWIAVGLGVYLVYKMASDDSQTAKVEVMAT